MTEEKTEVPQEVPDQTTPAHSTEEERERVKDFNKDGIPPGSCITGEGFGCGAVSPSTSFCTSVCGSVK